MKKAISKVLLFMLMLSFTVSVANAFTPPGLSKKGGLPPGIQKRFINKIDKDHHSYDTTIKDINLVEKRIVIHEGTALINLLVADNAKIELNSKDAKLEDLQVKDKVVIKTNKDNTIIEIKATGGNQVVPVPNQTKVNGTIKGIDSNRKEMIVEGNNTTGLYKYASNTLAYVDNKQVKIDDLKVGMEVTANLEGLQVKSVYAKSLAVKEFRATVKTVDLIKREVVLIYDNKEELYRVKADAIIKVNGITQNLSAINTGAIITVKSTGNEIVEIERNDGILQLEGRLMAKYTGTTPAVSVEIDKEIKVFNVKKDLDMTHVNVGKQVIVYIKDNIVIAIHEKN